MKFSAKMEHPLVPSPWMRAVTENALDSLEVFSTALDQEAPFERAINNERAAPRCESVRLEVAKMLRAQRRADMMSVLKKSCA